MDTVETSIEIERPAELVFKLWTEEMNLWWPRFGERFRYTFAPADVEPDQIHLEAEVGGRLYEVFASGEEFVIGRVIEVDPPRSITYTWRAREWDTDTTINVTFREVLGTTTVVTVRHSGFEALGLEEVAEGYGEGLEEVVGFFAKYASG